MILEVKPRGSCHSNWTLKCCQGTEQGTEGQDIHRFFGLRLISHILGVGLFGKSQEMQIMPGGL